MARHLEDDAIHPLQKENWCRFGDLRFILSQMRLSMQQDL